MKNTVPENEQVQLVLGHAAAVITLRIYARLWPGKEDRTRSPGGAGCGLGTLQSQENCRSKKVDLRDQAFLVSQKILSIWAM
ncbi:hypothetical protein GTW73_01150 [Streptomyces sp. SID4982]|nr:hypothetical protein [Streptomyces sp. SID4982]